MMKKKKVRIFTILLSILILLSGCGEKKTAADTELETLLPSSEETTAESSTEEAAAEPSTEAASEPEPESEPDIPAPQEVPEFVDEEDITTDIEAVFAAALDYMVPEEEADAAARVSNAILQQTSYRILEVSNTLCSIAIRYPDAAEALRKADAELSEDADEEQIEEMLLSLAQAIETEEVTMLEETFEVSIIELDGMRTIQWTPELYDAVTGGLFSAE